MPGFAAEMKKLCATCKVIYQNADGDIAKQQQQFNAVIAQGAKVVVLDPVDSAAAASLVQLAQSQGVKVIAYDRAEPEPVVLPVPGLIDQMVWKCKLRPGNTDGPNLPDSSAVSPSNPQPL